MIKISNGARVLYQWERGVTLSVTGACDIVRLSREDDSHAIDRVPALNGDEKTVVVPDHMLTESGYLRAMCIVTAGGVERVTETMRILIRPAQKPKDAAESTKDVMSWKELRIRMEALERAAREGKFDGKDGITPHVGENLNWWFGDVDTGIPASGEASVTKASIERALGYLPASESDVPKKTSDLNNDSGFITKLVEDLVNYYTKSETLTKDEINQLVSKIPKFSISVVSSLPSSNISNTTVYLVKSGTGGDLYTEYIYVNNAWEVLGSQKVDLTGYATQDWVNGELGRKLDASKLNDAINEALAQAKASGVFDGADGKDGKDGTSVTVTNVTPSNADGGNNVVTFSDGKTLTVKNGSKGSTGAAGAAGANGKDGKDGASVTVTNVTTSAADGGNNVVTFSDGKTLTVKNGSKGSTGATGAKGDKGDKGDPGTDATVTATNIKNALGFTPANAYDVAEIPRKATPQMYGAKGDGSTDDTAAFKAALAAERVVFVPGGTYKLSSGINIGGNCMLELSQDTVLVFTNTTGYCINLDMSSTLKGNHATIKVPYWFEGSVLYAYSCDRTEIEQKQIPPWTLWDPQWKTARYITDINICKDDSSQGEDRGYHYAVNPTDCRGTAVYIEADKTSGMSSYMWSNHFSGIRIAGAFSYGIRAVTKDGGYLNDMRIEAVYMDACEIGVSLEECDNVYVSASIQPRRAYTLDKVYKPYAKHGVQLIRSKNVDLSSTRVWDWNAKNTLWTDGGEYQHISMIGECRGAILGDFKYYEDSIDLRKLIYTDTPSNLSQLVILQEPIDRWFRMRDGIPYCTDGTMEYRLLTDGALDPYFTTDAVKYFTDVLESATDTDGVTIFNGIGYQEGIRFEGMNEGVALTPSVYYMTTGFIPVRQGSVLDCNDLSFADVAKGYAGIVYYDSNRQRITNIGIGNIVNGNSYYYVNSYAETKKGCTFKIGGSVNLNELAYIRLVFPMTGVGTNPMIAVDEKIEYTIEGFLANGIKVKGENVIGTPGQITPDWVATKEEVGGDTIIIPEQKIAYGMWSQLQVYINVGVTYDVYINGTVYACTAYNYDGGIVLGNYTIAQAGADVPHNNEPFYIFWAGGSATAGMFDKDSTLSYPITIKVTDHVQTVYNKMPVGYLPEGIVMSVNGMTPDINGNVNIPTGGGGGSADALIGEFSIGSQNCDVSTDGLVMTLVYNDELKASVQAVLSGLLTNPKRIYLCITDNHGLGMVATIPSVMMGASVDDCAIMSIFVDGMTTNDGSIVRSVIIQGGRMLTDNNILKTFISYGAAMVVKVYAVCGTGQVAPDLVVDAEILDEMLGEVLS